MQLSVDGRWQRVSDETRPHLVALFRDPAIATERRVDFVLDIGAPEACRTPGWLHPFLTTISGLPPGLVVALDNGVRCPCPKKAGRALYRDRAALCLSRTRSWLESLSHPHGGRPNVVVCDRDLAYTLASLGALTLADGSPWVEHRPWLTCVGSAVRVFDRSGVVLAHPSVVLHPRRRPAYVQRVVATVSALIALAVPVP